MKKLDDNDGIANINPDKDDNNEYKRNIINKYKDVLSNKLDDFIRINNDHIMRPIVWYRKEIMIRVVVAVALAVSML